VLLGEEAFADEAVLSDDGLGFGLQRLDGGGDCGILREIAGSTLWAEA